MTDLIVLNPPNLHDRHNARLSVCLSTTIYLLYDLPFPGSSSLSDITNMMSRARNFVLLNQTNEELVLDQNSANFVHSRMIREPPQSILAGEYGVWTLATTHLLGSVKGGLQYAICGGGPEEKMIFCWNNSILGGASYQGTQASEGYEIYVLGGKRLDSIVVIVFSMWGSPSATYCSEANLL